MQIRKWLKWYEENLTQDTTWYELKVRRRFNHSPSELWRLEWPSLFRKWILWSDWIKKQQEKQQTTSNYIEEKWREQKKIEKVYETRQKEKKSHKKILFRKKLFFLFFVFFKDRSESLAGIFEEDMEWERKTDEGDEETEFPIKRKLMLI